ncbi:M14 family zinc carboxypeptidase [Bacillus mesophilum]|uniref:Carboxypeptidase n=1 Tax=Bacillus mesophilum TaxID=1071718 RepID=A0A7V7UTR8_9BACI|nr:M14 family zinc carboxypeptidase [Bacillus mesophilum]KAB2331033.1 carboxypeptidase [Bacillus mesophilum]
MKRIVLLFAVFFFAAGWGANAAIINPHAPYHYDILKQDLKTMKKQYRFMKVKKFGKSSFGRNLYAVRLGKGNRNILIVGSHHGREWLTTSLTMKMMEDYAYAYHQKKGIGGYSYRLLDEISIWFIPMLNPDGVVLQQEGIDAFPKGFHGRLLEMNDGRSDFTSWKANGIGIDLNRQYPSGWDELQTGSELPSWQFYKGKHPVEAAEVKALIRFVYKINPELAVAYHSSGQEVFWDYHNGAHSVRDRAIANEVAELTGYPLSEPSAEAVGGGFKDWFISEFRKPAMTIEICRLVEDRAPPTSEFHKEWERNQHVGILLAQEAKKMIEKENR